MHFTTVSWIWYQKQRNIFIFSSHPYLQSFSAGVFSSSIIAFSTMKIFFPPSLTRIVLLGFSLCCVEFFFYWKGRFLRLVCKERKIWYPKQRNIFIFSSHPYLQSCFLFEYQSSLFFFSLKFGLIFGLFLLSYSLMSSLDFSSPHHFFCVFYY